MALEILIISWLSEASMADIVLCYECDAMRLVRLLQINGRKSLRQNQAIHSLATGVCLRIMLTIYRSPLGLEWFQARRNRCRSQSWRSLSDICTRQ